MNQNLRRRSALGVYVVHGAVKDPYKVSKPKQDIGVKFVWSIDQDLPPLFHIWGQKFPENPGVSTCRSKTLFEGVRWMVREVIEKNVDGNKIEICGLPFLCKDTNAT